MGFFSALSRKRTGADLLADVQTLTARRVALALDTAERRGRDPAVVLGEMREVADRELRRFLEESPRKPHMVMAANETVLEINRRLAALDPETHK